MEKLCVFSNAVINQPLSVGDDSISVMEYRGSDTQCVVISNQHDAFFAGHTTKGVLSSWFLGVFPQRIVELMVKAINNRTRERNFSRLSEQLALGEISEEEFDRTIEEREEEFVIKCDVEPSETDLKVAAYLAPQIMDVEDTDDLAVLFSFDETVIRQYLKE